jgi:hypothetical protein
MRAVTLVACRAFAPLVVPGSSTVLAHLGHAFRAYERTVTKRVPTPPSRGRPATPDSRIRPARQVNRHPFNLPSNV